MLKIKQAWSSDVKYMRSRLVEKREHGYLEIEGEVITPYGIVIVNAGHMLPDETSTPAWGYAHFQFMLRGRFVSYSVEGNPILSKRQALYWAKRTIREAHSV